MAAGHSFTKFGCRQYITKKKKKKVVIQELVTVVHCSQKFPAAGKHHLMNFRSRFPGNAQPHSFPDELPTQRALRVGSRELPAAQKAPAPPSTGPRGRHRGSSCPPWELGMSPSGIPHTTLLQPAQPSVPKHRAVTSASPTPKKAIAN